MRKLKKLYYAMGVSMTMGLMGIAPEAFAGGGGGGGNDASTIAGNVVTSIEKLPSLLSALSYLGGITIGTLGVLKIKDHVENPSQTPLKEGAIRLATGGALLSLPIIFEAMTSSVGTGTAPTQTNLNSLSF